MKIAWLDGVNILLIIFSAIIAFFIPFQLFLFSYAVLGPLHYLTELSWLHKKQYFVPIKQRYLVPVATLIVLLFMVLAYTPWFRTALIVLLVVFLGALIVVSIKNTLSRVVLLVFLLVVAVVTRHSPALFAIALLLPTAVHVFVFTAAFMLYGALKNKSIWGGISVLVLLLAALALFLASVNGQAFTVSSYIRSAYVSFESTNLAIMSLLSIRNANISNAVFASAAGLSIMRFLAFAYTYHYANWFSKTTIIRWHAISRQRLTLIGILWLLAILLYLYNYTVGFIALYFLSLLHVLLEFPLDQLTLVGVFREIKKLFTTSPKTA